MAFQKITESESLYDNLDQMSVRELLEGINNEDRKVAIAVGREIPKIEKLVTRIVEAYEKHDKKAAATRKRNTAKPVSEESFVITDLTSLGDN